MPGEAGCGPFVRLGFHFSHAPPNGYQVVSLRWPGLLDRNQALVERAFPLVAHGHGTGTCAARPPSADAAGRRQSRRGSSTGMAAVEPLKEISLKKHKS